VAEGLALLRRLGALWRVQAHLDLLFMLRDVRSFLWYVGSDLVLGVAAVTATLLLAERFDGIGVWSKAQVLFMLGYAITSNGLLDMFFGYNVRFISRRIGRGQLDHLLIQPRPLWLALLTEGFVPWSSGLALLPGVALMAWAGRLLGLAPAPLWLLALLLNLLASMAIVLAFLYAWGSLAFWAPRAAEEVTSSANRLIGGLRAFPLDGLRPLLRGGLLTLVPAGFVAWYPCRALLGLDPAPHALAVTPLVAVAMATIAGVIFARGLQQYARTGSSRYLSFGHRR
jgi:ABC-2 type transport system permease protein